MFKGAGGATDPTQARCIQSMLNSTMLRAFSDPTFFFFFFNNTQQNSNITSVNTQGALGVLGIESASHVQGQHLNSYIIYPVLIPQYI